MIKLVHNRIIRLSTTADLLQLAIFAFLWYFLVIMNKLNVCRSRSPLAKHLSPIYPGEYRAHIYSVLSITSRVKTIKKSMEQQYRITR